MSWPIGSSRRAAHTFDARNLDGEPVFGWSPRTELVTTLTVLYDPDPDGGAWRGSQELRSTRLTDAVRLPPPGGQAGPGRARSPAAMGAPAGHGDDRSRTYWLSQWETPRHDVYPARLLGRAGAREERRRHRGRARSSPRSATVGFAIRAKRYRLGRGHGGARGRGAGPLPSVLDLPAAICVWPALTHAGAPRAAIASGSRRP